MKKILTGFAFLLMVCNSNAQNPFTTGRNASAKEPENYFASVKALQAIKIDSTNRDDLDRWYQSLITYQSFLGDYKSVLTYDDKRYQYGVEHKQVVVDTAFTKQHKLVNATDYVIAQAKLHQVVMVNEAHHIPYHRAFAISLLKGFYDAGYRYLAIETLSDSLINQKQYPDRETGFYTREPLFGEMIREALKISLKLVAYEPEQECDHKSTDPNYCSTFRDSLMAVNLNKILLKDPKAKILIYAGYDHIFEASNDSWKKMAQFFKQFTGIDPFTVDLVQGVEHLHPQLNSKEFNAVNRLAHIKQPVVALQNSQPWHRKFVDANVTFPEYLKGDARPSFYNINGSRKRYDVKNIGGKPDQLVQAFYANEKPGNRIPADQLIVGATGNQLYLFKGSYELEIKDGNGALVKKVPVLIK